MTQTVLFPTRWWSDVRQVIANLSGVGMYVPHLHQAAAAGFHAINSPAERVARPHLDQLT
jgi:hypothetical protein